MKQFKRTFGSIYSEEEEKILGPWQRIRQGILSPIAFVLSRAGISPNMLSYTSIALSVVFCLLAPIQYTVAFWLLVAAVACDALDGVEARLNRTTSARGSFTDMFCDEATAAFTTAGIAWKGLVQPALAIIFVFTYTALVTFLMLHRMLQVSSRWIVRPSRMVLYAAVALDFFFHVNLLNSLLLIYLLALPLLVLSFWRLRRAL